MNPQLDELDKLDELDELLTFNSMSS